MSKINKNEMKIKWTLNFIRQNFQHRDAFIFQILHWAVVLTMNSMQMILRWCCVFIWKTIQCFYSSRSGFSCAHLKGETCWTKLFEWREERYRYTLPKDVKPLAKSIISNVFCTTTDEWIVWSLQKRVIHLLVKKEPNFYWRKHYFLSI